jgi:hypothetical protein
MILARVSLMFIAALIGFGGLVGYVLGANIAAILASGLASIVVLSRTELRRIKEYYELPFEPMHRSKST